MIFVTVGSQMFQMNRLLEEIDRLIANDLIHDEVFAQSGWCTYKPKHFRYAPFVDRDVMHQYIQHARLVICHTGSSSIITCLKEGKKVIVVPRRADLGEHVDDHQFELADVFEKLHYVLVVHDISQLIYAIESSNNFIPNAYESKTDSFITFLNNVLEDYR